MMKRQYILCKKFDKSFHSLPRFFVEGTELLKNFLNFLFLTQSYLLRNNYLIEAVPFKSHQGGFYTLPLPPDTLMDEREITLASRI